MRFKHLVASVPLVLPFVILTTAVAQEARVTESRSTSSSCTVVLESPVCTWVVTEAGSAVELGATIPLALIEAVPSDAEMVWPPQELAAVALPSEARTMLGLDHLGINWEAHGHPPTSFLTEHFDFHFYNIGEAEVRAIDCSDETKPSKLPRHLALPDIEIPEMGVLVGLCVPLMGMHAMAEQEIGATEPFEASMMVGYYGGDPIFLEPMVSRALLLEKSDFSLPVPEVENLPAGVRYPSQFRAEYDNGAREYRLIFTGF